ncbi:MAG: hypothetical protein ACKOC5_12505, partial [Chloroflexota bacterium]
MSRRGRFSNALRQLPELGSFGWSILLAGVFSLAPIGYFMAALLALGYSYGYVLRIDRLNGEARPAALRQQIAMYLYSATGDAASWQAAQLSRQDLAAALVNLPGRMWLPV